MKTISSKGVILTTLFGCMAFWNAACVNSIEEDAEIDVEEGTTPITFSIKMEKETTRVTNTTFEKGDKMGLFATTASGSIKGKRYIDNLTLEYTEGSTLTPKKAVFYPEGDVALDFISYYPYQPDGVPAGSSLIPVSVQIDQSSDKNRSQSDFLIAKTGGITNKSKAVTLEFQHKLSKLTITLTPDASNTADNLLKANPRIIATGLKTSANYNLEDGTFSNLEGTKDIVASGDWKTDKDGKLVGKEIIIIPQAIDGDGQSFIMEWNGRIYSCAIPKVEMGSSMQCPINISTMQSNSNVLSSFAGKIKEWTNIDPMETDNTEDYTAVHISALSFSQSSVYRIYHEGTPVAEVCKEYLTDPLTSRAIVAYPVAENEKTDLRNGIILQLTDRSDMICGGKISWNTDDYGFTYTEGDATSIDKFYIDDAHNLSLKKPKNAVKVNIASHTLLDIRKGITDEYPITKIGRQYWMREELRATTYQDGTALKKQIDLGKDKAGYYKPDKYNIYFYNGEAILGGELTPDGWKIPSDNDWEQLKGYIGNDAALLKAGEWQTMISGEVVPVNNYAQFNAFPVGMWYNKEHNSPYKMTAFWSWDKAKNTLSEKTVYFLGESNEFVQSTAHVSNKDYYKALSIRCIKE